MAGRRRTARQRSLARSGFGDLEFTCVELVLALGIVVTLASLVVPATAEVVDASRAWQAAGFPPSMRSSHGST
jgi:type II secretory pathway pseudopilin PulG